MVVSRNSIPAYCLLRKLPIMCGAVWYCSYQQCTTASKLLSMPPYSPIANFFCILSEITLQVVYLHLISQVSSFGRTAKFKIRSMPYIKNCPNALYLASICCFRSTIPQHSGFPVHEPESPKVAIPPTPLYRNGSVTRLALTALRIETLIP